MPAPRTVAAIDAGSNAIRAVVSAVMGPNDFLQLESERIPVRLGHNAFTREELDGETIDAAVAAFARFRKLFDYHKVERYRAVATSATRTVRNRELLMQRIYYETGIDLEVIDGEEEIRLVRHAIQHEFGDQEPPSSLMDLGGGSLEIGARRGGEWTSVSLPIGTVRMMETFDIYDEISASEVEMLDRYMGTVMDAHQLDQYDVGEGRCVATGGNADELAELFGKKNDSGMYEIGLDTLRGAADEILPLTVEERMKKYDVRKDRAEVMGIAAIVFIEAMKRAGFESYIAPDVGVREGVQLELSEQMTEERSVPVSVNSALLGSFRVYMRRLGHDPAHGEQVREIAVRLFDELQDVHGLDDSARLILELAALTHDVGEVVNRKKHHKHSEYLLLKGRIPGLESPMREMVAALARVHRKAKPKKKHKAFKKLNKEQREVIRKLMPILRIADALDTDHRHLIRDVEATHQGDEIKLALHMKHNPGLTTATFARRNEVFENYYEIPISMEIVE